MIANQVRKIVYRYWQNFHAIRRVELARLKCFLQVNSSESGKSIILDLGCGKGYFSRILYDAGCQVFGIDPNVRDIDIAKRFMPKEIDFRVGVGEKLPYEDGTFDKVVSVCVLEHTQNDKSVLEEINRVLKLDGIFAFSVDCMNSKYIGKAFIEHHVQEYHVNQLYDGERIRNVLEETGFQLVELDYFFDSDLSAGLLRFGSRFHYRSLFLLLFPIVYPLLWIDDKLTRKKTGGAIMVVGARKQG